ncbi:MAG TPA: glycosyltransferase [Pseudonocardiaceae bacterium]
MAPEVLALRSFGEVADTAAEQGVVLVPMVLAPLPVDGLNPGDAIGTELGGFDPGFIAVGPAGREFVDFWARRAREELLASPFPSISSVLPVARRWLDEVPGLFAPVVLRDPTFGVAYWNLHERSVSGARYLNLAGYSPERPWLLSADCADRPRVLLSGDAELRAIVDAYGERLRAGAAEPYGFGFLGDGSAVTSVMRRAFRDALREWERACAGLVPLHQGQDDGPPPHPFGDDGDAGFVEWLASAGSLPERGAGLNRLVLGLWAERADLMVTFPRPCYEGAAGFRAWCELHGVAEGLVPEWAMPVEPVEPAGPVAQFGVNLAGYLTAEFGLGEMGRVLHTVLHAAEVPTVAVVEERSLSALVRTALDAPEDLAAPRFPISVLAVNADYTELLLASHPELGRDRYRIGFWAWELEEFPERFDVGFGLVDEVWANSDFARDAIARRASVPVKTFPVPVPDPGVPERVGGPTTFLFAFDFNSTGGRKNPWGVVSAFQRAFVGRDDVRLVIKATNEHSNAAAAERLRYVVGADSRVELVERYLSVAELGALYARCDAYVSLHRSEGFGLTVAEAMIRGIPVISTDYSATREFVDERVGWPIPYTLVEVGEGWAPYQPEAKWAEPDLDAAAAAMRAVADHPDEARRRGAAAREHLLRTRSVDAAARWVREQVDAAYQSWQGRRAEPVDNARLPLGPALRRVARRAIAHNDALLSRLDSRMAASAGADAARLAAFRRALDRRGEQA